MNLPCLLIGGTDTGVGKTIITGLLLYSFIQCGQKPRVVKPIETGCVNGPLDGKFLSSFVQRWQSSFFVSPWCFTPSVLPALASRESSDLTPRLICESLENQMQKGGILLVEGAGGVLVDLVDNYSFADLAGDLNAPVLLVVGNRLGCLNHATLSIEVLQKRGVKVMGYVLNDFLNSHEQSYYEYSQEALDTNRGELQSIGSKYGVKEIFHLPYFKDFAQPSIKSVKAFYALHPSLLKVLQLAFD